MCLAEEAGGALPSSWSSPAGPGVRDTRAQRKLTQSSVALWVWTTNQETWTSTWDRMDFKRGESKDAIRKETGQGGICAPEVQGGHQWLPSCLSHLPRYNAQGLRAVIRVKILAFPGDFSQACIPGQCADHEPPRGAMLLRQVSSENN